MCNQGGALPFIYHAGQKEGRPVFNLDHVVVAGTFSSTARNIANRPLNQVMLVGSLHAWSPEGGPCRAAGHSSRVYVPTDGYEVLGACRACGRHRMGRGPRRVDAATLRFGTNLRLGAGPYQNQEQLGQVSRRRGELHTHLPFTEYGVPAGDRGGIGAQRGVRTFSIEIARTT